MNSRDPFQIPFALRSVLKSLSNVKLAVEIPLPRWPGVYVPPGVKRDQLVAILAEHNCHPVFINDELVRPPLLTPC